MYRYHKKFTVYRYLYCYKLSSNSVNKFFQNFFRSVHITAAHTCQFYPPKQFGWNLPALPNTAHKIEAFYLPLPSAPLVVLWCMHDRGPQSLQNRSILNLTQTPHYDTILALSYISLPSNENTLMGLVCLVISVPTVYWVQYINYKQQTDDSNYSFT